MDADKRRYEELDSEKETTKETELVLRSGAQLRRVAAVASPLWALPAVRLAGEP